MADTLKVKEAQYASKATVLVDDLVLKHRDLKSQIFGIECLIRDIGKLYGFELHDVLPELAEESTDLDDSQSTTVAVVKPRRGVKDSSTVLIEDTAIQYLQGTPNAKAETGELIAALRDAQINGGYKRLYGVLARSKRIQYRNHLWHLVVERAA